MAYSGKFVPKNIKKYKGDYTKIYYRSLWERNYMVKLDNDPNVLSWNSEEVVIPYRCETDMEIHRYFMDFWVKLKQPDHLGYTERLIEIKPHAQTLDPTINPKTKSRKKLTKRVVKESLVYKKNISKWKAAQKFCKKRNMRFMILTEYSLGIKKPKK